MLLENVNLRVAIASECNLNCVYCEGSAGYKPDKPGAMEDFRRNHKKFGNINTGTLLNIVKLFHKNGFIGLSLTGGEPLLNKDWDKIVKKASDIGMSRVEVTTNGILLEKYLQKNVKLPKGLTLVKISLDTIDPMRFKKVTGGGDFNKVIRAVKMISPYVKTRANKVLLRSDWEFIRESGYGAQYKNWIVDPMFDSELFTIYNIFIKLKNKYPDELNNPADFFVDLFKSLETGASNKNHIIKEFANWLPCDVFVCEEHLKNWIVKRLYSEKLLLNDEYITKKYFITGMGLLFGERMSASRGHAILAKDLINSYGSLRARLIMLLTGGHPSKIYQYDTNLPQQADKLLKKVINYTTYLATLVLNKKIESDKNDIHDLEILNKKLECLLKNGYYRQVILELVTIVPKNFRNPNSKSAIKLLNIYKKYFSILLPSLIL